jgi:hypothetical protein
MLVVCQGTFAHRQAGTERVDSQRGEELGLIGPWQALGAGSAARTPEKPCLVTPRGRRWGKARDFASFASFASLVAPSRCLQTGCANDAKCETACCSRHTGGVRVMRSSLCVGRAMFGD